VTANTLYGDDNDIDGSPYGKKDGRDGPLSGERCHSMVNIAGDDDGTGRKGSSPDFDGKKRHSPGSGRRAVMERSNLWSSMYSLLRSRRTHW